ncbi:MAG: CYTH domain-containing protein [Paludibacteraceae bacterium]|nr:CYTH domain-containing protein [Paludibacteraceae bacterium]
MNVEIERKFLMSDDSWRAEAGEGVHYAQGYLNKNGNTVRVRIAGSKGYLTIKSKTVSFSRMEFEYEIPVDDAKAMLPLSQTPIVEKYRYKIKRGKHTWEIDEFLGDNEGLIVAEIELESEAETFDVPQWIGQEVTGDKRYYNSHLAENPYKNWK